jgi:hypothetical protein
MFFEHAVRNLHPGSLTLGCPRSRQRRRRLDEQIGCVDDLQKDGGAGGDRTPDLDIANVALSQLSYGPGGCAFCALDERT